MVNEIMERISEIFYTAKASGEQVVILLRDETVETLLKSSEVSFKNGDFVFKIGDEKLAVGIDSSKIIGPHAYVRTYNGQWTCAVPKVDGTDVPKITL